MTEISKLLAVEVKGVSGGLTKTVGFGTRDEEARLRQAEERLVQLKHEFASRCCEERMCIATCRSRVGHLRKLPTSSSVRNSFKQRAEVTKLENVRLYRMIVDHMLRMGDAKTARTLATYLELERLTDLDVYESSRAASEALRSRSCAAALKWCSTRQSKLRRVGSKVEFRIRIAEFIELIRSSHSINAVKYARKHLVGWASSDPVELKRAMACLAFGKSTNKPPFRDMFSACAWTSLRKLFDKECGACSGVTKESSLSANLRAGIISLKLDHVHIFSRDANSFKGNTQNVSVRDDPLSVKSLGGLSFGLPYSKHTNSKIICQVTRSVMDEKNPPMVLPNGFVYSARAVKMFSYGLDTSTSGLVSPRSGRAFDNSELRKAFFA